MPTTLEMFQFKGLRNDVGKKFVPIDYFYSVSNVNQDDIVGANKSLCPALISLVDLDNPIDGIFKYSYLRSSQVPYSDRTIQKMINTEIIACGGKLYNSIGHPVEFFSGMSKGKCQATILNDKLFICNGKDYIKVLNGVTMNVSEMGAPEANIPVIDGSLSGTYHYAMTYVTAGGEEVLGTVSNIVKPNGKQVTLSLPIGYLGTLSRKIYRTTNGGTTLKLLTTIANNTTLTYTDDTADSSLGSEIPSINNECPRPRYITTSTTFNIVCSGDDTFPSQAYMSGTNVEVIDKATYIDISNRGQDNTPITGMSDDYGKIIIGTKKQIYFLDVSGTTATVTLTRSNIGVLDGYSMVKMPSNSGFAGGVMFVASDRTVRVMNGNYADPVPTSLDNIKTENWAQPIRGSLNSALNGYSNLCTAYFDYKYHLVVDSKFYIFDTRTLAWQILEFRTTNNICVPNVLVNFDDDILYVGRQNGGYIEKMYSDTLYIGEDLPAYIEFPYWAVSEELKFFKELHIYYLKQSELDITIDVNIGDSSNSPISADVSEVTTQVFSSDDFDPTYYATGTITEDYKVVYLNKYGTCIDFKITIPARDKLFSVFDSTYFDENYYITDKANLNPFGNIAFIRGIRLVYDEVSNKE